MRPISPRARWAHLPNLIDQIERANYNIDAAANEIVFGGLVDDLPCSPGGKVLGPNESYGNHIAEPGQPDHSLIEWHAPKNAYLAEHMHTPIEFVRVLDGRLRFTGHGWESVVCPGEVLTIKPYTMHDVEVDAGSRFDVLFVPSLKLETP